MLRYIMCVYLLTHTFNQSHTDWRFASTLPECVLVHVICFFSQASYPATPSTTVPSIPARRNPGPPVISPRPAQYKLPPPPRATNGCAGDPPTDRQTIRGFIDDHPKDVVQQQPQQPQQPQQQPPQPQQPPQLRARRFKVPPPIKCISEPLDGSSRESYEMMTPAMTMSPNRQVRW